MTDLKNINLSDFFRKAIFIKILVVEVAGKQATKPVTFKQSDNAVDIFAILHKAFFVFSVIKGHLEIAERCFEFVKIFNNFNIIFNQGIFHLLVNLGVVPTESFVNENFFFVIRFQIRFFDIDFWVIYHRVKSADMVGMFVRDENGVYVRRTQSA